MMMMMMMMMNCFCGMTDRQKAFSLVFSQDHCQRSSPSWISDTPWARFELAQNLSSDLVEWSYGYNHYIMTPQDLLNKEHYCYKINSLLMKKPQKNNQTTTTTTTKICLLPHSVDNSPLYGLSPHFNKNILNLDLLWYFQNLNPL